MESAGTELRPGLPRWVEAPVAVLALILCSPIILLLAALVWFTSHGPAFFRQTRIGRGGTPFTLLKLRTMRSPRRSDPYGSDLSSLVTARGDSRVTPVGRILRRAKLDELPELLNIVRGEMSFVGPRPEVERYVDMEDALWQKVLTARPGLTDPTTLRLRNEEAVLARIGGSSEDSYRQVLLPFKLRSSARYLECRNAWSDVSIFLRTLVAILWARGEPTLEDLRSPK